MSVSFDNFLESLFKGLNTFIFVSFLKSTRKLFFQDQSFTSMNLSNLSRRLFTIFLVAFT